VCDIVSQAARGGPSPYKLAWRMALALREGRAPQAARAGAKAADAPWHPRRTHLKVLLRLPTAPVLLP